jgi:hypothetical protein
MSRVSKDTQGTISGPHPNANFLSFQAKRDFWNNVGFNPKLAACHQMPNFTPITSIRAFFLTPP